MQSSSIVSSQCKSKPKLTVAKQHDEAPAVDDGSSWVLDDGVVRGERAAPRLLRVRRLAGGQRQQQLPDDDGAGRLAAVRPGLPDAPRHGTLLQRSQRGGHHQRVSGRRARSAVPQPSPGRPQAVRRSKLCVSRSRDPQRHRHPVCQHHPHPEAASVLRAVPEPGASSGRRRGDAAAGAGRPGAHHPWRQRLRQQLLPGAILGAFPGDGAAGLRALPHQRVRQDPSPAARPGRSPRPRHRLRSHRLRTRRAGSPGQPRRRVRPGAAARRRALQPAAGGHDPWPQRRARRRRLRRRQCLPDAHGLHLRPGGVRLRHLQGGVLRPGPLQWRRTLHRRLQRLPRPQPLRLLGQLPPNGEGQPHHRQPVHGRHTRLHAPAQPLHHPRHGRPLLNYIFILIATPPHPTPLSIYLSIYYTYIQVCMYVYSPIIRLQSIHLRLEIEMRINKVPRQVQKHFIAN